MQMTNKAWGKEDAISWRENQNVKRSYVNEVVSKIMDLKSHFEVIQYDLIEYSPQTYPLFYLKSKILSPQKPTILITGGVHGYETSGVHGALLFMQDHAKDYESDFNLICFPCISPWGYETINRWNPDALDPNRNFHKDSKAQECSKLYRALELLDLEFLAHFDLHETTDTDNTVFRPDLEKRDGITQELWEIPDGFYLVADTHRKTQDFQASIIKSVQTVTHIAPTDEEGKIIGVPELTTGVINYDVKKLNLCAGLTNAPYVTTTEVYPDSPKVTSHECNQAQAYAIMGGLDYLKGQI